MTYFLAKAFFEIIPMRALPPLLLGSIAYWMMGFQPVAAKFAVFLFILLLVNVVATAMCIAIGTTVPSVAVGNLISVCL